VSTDLELRRLQADVLLDLQRIRHASERRVGELLAAEGLEVTPAQANVLLILIQKRVPLTARQLAAEMALSEVTVGRFVRALEEAGWLERPTSGVHPGLDGLLDDCLGGFDADQISTLASMLQHMRQRLDTPRCVDSDSRPS
jgi:hypothetical protein